MSFHVPETARDTTHPIMRTTSADGHNGVFKVVSPEPGWMLWMIASDGEGWEHVSVQAVSARNTDKSRVPTWKEMCFVKDLFWEDEDEVIQYHPKRSEYVNCHPHVLHLWRPIGVTLPPPPSIMVGPPTK